MSGCTGAIRQARHPRRIYGRREKSDCNLSREETRPGGQADDIWATRTLVRYKGVTITCGRRQKVCVSGSHGLLRPMAFVKWIGPKSVGCFRLTTVRPNHARQGTRFSLLSAGRLWGRGQLRADGCAAVSGFLVRGGQSDLITPQEQAHCINRCDARSGSSN